jgi:hypothetical protein
MSKKWFESLDPNGSTWEGDRPWVFVNIETGSILRPKYTTSEHPYHDIPAIECEVGGKKYAIWLGEPIKQHGKSAITDFRQSRHDALNIARDRVLSMVMELNGETQDHKEIT